MPLEAPSAKVQPRSSRPASPFKGKKMSLLHLSVTQNRIEECLSFSSQLLSSMANMACGQLSIHSIGWVSIAVLLARSLQTVKQIARRGLSGLLNTKTGQ